MENEVKTETREVNGVINGAANGADGKACAATSAAVGHKPGKAVVTYLLRHGKPQEVDTYLLDNANHVRNFRALMVELAWFPSDVESVTISFV